MIIELNINKTNTALISTNSTRVYITGIGWTNYTVHNDANDIKEMYRDKYGIFRNFSINDFHNYHVFTWNLKSILENIKWKETFDYKGQTYKINEAYIGLHDKVELKSRYVTGRGFVSGFDGEKEIQNISNRLKYIIDVTKLSV